MLSKKNKSIHARERTNNVIVFLLAFVVFLVVFGGICLWAVIKINQERRSAESPTSSDLSETVQFDDTDANNLMIVMVDNGTAQGFVSLRFDPAKSKISALAIPRDTVVDYKLSEIRLFELYDKHGVQSAKDAFSSLTDIEFDNYYVITYEKIGSLIEHLESDLVMTLNENLEYSDNNLSIHISGGRRTLSAAQVIDILRYPAWRGGRIQRSAIQAQITAALINQYMKPTRKTLADSDFGTIVNLALKTDILVSHYRNAKAGLAFLAERNDGSICTDLTLPGKYEGSGNSIRYYTPDNIKEMLQSSYY
ncbi:MAG: LCP family protein [Oscillospiraceae bacterium]|nr:LCP family protein [Oscillospiraceae bacterium]